MQHTPDSRWASTLALLLLVILSLAARPAIGEEDGLAPQDEEGAETPTDLEALNVVLPVPVIREGKPVEILFSEPLVADSGEQFWVTVLPIEAADTRWSAWTYVDAGATRVAVTPRETGRLEVRLHAHYPTETTHVIWRAPVEVLPAEPQ